MPGWLGQSFGGLRIDKIWRLAMPRIGWGEVFHDKLEDEYFWKVHAWPPEADCYNRPIAEGASSSLFQAKLHAEELLSLIDEVEGEGGITRGIGYDNTWGVPKE